MDAIRSTGIGFSFYSFTVCFLYFLVDYWLLRVDIDRSRDSSPGVYAS